MPLQVFLSFYQMAFAVGFGPVERALSTSHPVGALVEEVVSAVAVP